MSTQHAETGPAVPVDTFELRLVIARFAAGQLTADAAGKLVGATGTTWGNWEKGRHRPNDAMIAYISRQLGCDETWLREGGPLKAATDRPDDGGRARQDSNLRPADYTDSLLAQRNPGVFGRFRDRRAQPRIRPLLPPIEADDYPRAA